MDVTRRCLGDFVCAAIFSTLIIASPPALAKKGAKTPEAPQLSLANVPSIEWVIKLKKRHGIGRGLYQFSTPLVVGDHVFAGSAGGRVISIDRHRGEKAWSLETEGPVIGPIRSFGDHIYFGDSKGILYSVSTQKGEADWKSPLGGEIAAAPLVTEQTVYAVTAAGELVAADRATGAQKWRTPRRTVSAPFTVRGASSPVMVDGRIAVGYPDGVVASHDPANGNTLWQPNLASPAAVLQDVDTTPVRIGELLIVATVDGTTAAISARDGRVVWQVKTGTPNEIASDGGTIYMAASGKVTAFDARSGSTIWQTAIPDSETSGPAIVGDKLFLISSIDQVYIVDRRDGTFMGKRHMGTGSYGQPVSEGNRVYLVTNAGNVVALKIP